MGFLCLLAIVDLLFDYEGTRMEVCGKHSCNWLHEVVSQKVLQQSQRRDLK